MELVVCKVFDQVRYQDYVEKSVTQRERKGTAKKEHELPWEFCSMTLGSGAADHFIRAATPLACAV